MRGPLSRAAASAALVPFCRAVSAHVPALLDEAEGEPGVCRPEPLPAGLRCYGLEPDAAADSAGACGGACCGDRGCETWQFHPDYGCFRGRATICLPETSTFAQGSLGARLRSPARQDDGKFVAAASGFAEMMWSGARADFSTFEAVEPYVQGPDVKRYTGGNGETYVLRRHGPEADDLDVSLSCWSGTQQPSNCCGTGARECWGLPEFRTRCCELGMTEPQDYMYFVYDIFVMISGHFTPNQRSAWDSTFPGLKIDQAGFSAKRMRWRTGHHDHGLLCPARGGRDSSSWQAIDSQTVLWPLVRLLMDAGVALSGTFLNIGAGTCLPPDPMYQLAFSAEGRGFTGLAVDANSTDLQRCSRAMQNASAKVIPLHAAVDPLTAAELLRPHLASLFGAKRLPWPLDIMVIDIDGCDCLVTEELLLLVRPKVLIVEMAFHFPPPFRFSAQHDPVQSAEWLREYDVNKFNPASGCSLSYAIHRFRPFGLHLLRLTHLDAVFVHESLAPAVEWGLGQRLPQDEFACYRQSSLWVQMPIEYVREWFFAKHPADSLGYIWANISQLNREVDRSLAPFVLDY